HREARRHRCKRNDREAVADELSARLRSSRCHAARRTRGQRRRPRSRNAGPYWTRRPIWTSAHHGIRAVPMARWLLQAADMKQFGLCLLFTQACTAGPVEELPTGSLAAPAPVLADAGAPASSPIALAGGQWHTLILRSDGTVYASGWNGDGQLGLGNLTN